MLTTEKFVELIEDAGYEVRRYSGRGMYGKWCVGVEVDGDMNGYKLVCDVVRIAAVQDEDDIDELINVFSNTNQDSMGLGMVIYWPKMKITKE